MSKTASPFVALTAEIRSKKLAPVYFFYGEETFFLDKLTNEIDENALKPEERDFNRDILFGADADSGKLLTALRGFPSFAERKLVILKEAQSLREKEWEKILPYFSKPNPSTVFVVVYREGKLKAQAKKALEATLKLESAKTFESKKLYESGRGYSVPVWVQEWVETQGFSVEPAVCNEIVGFLGANLGLIENELNKIFIDLRAKNQSKLTRELVLDALNIDREYNIFELVKALSKKEVSKSHLIVHHLTQNLKANPAVGMVSMLFSYFVHPLCRAHALKLRDGNAIQNQLGIRNYYAAQDLAEATAKYPPIKAYKILSFVLEADLMLKGVTPTEMEDEHILKTLVFQIVNV